MLCKICGQRRAKRYCPAVSGDICPICCGNEREVTLTCPLDCEYLREGHKREKPLEVLEKDIAYPEIQIDESFLVAHEELMLFTIYSLVQAALRTAGAIDSDVMAALEATVQTRRTLDSGLVYETRAENTIAAGVQRLLAASLHDYSNEQEEREPLSPLRNSDVQKILVLLLRMGQRYRSERPRSRLFIDLLRQMTPDNAPLQQSAGLIIE